MYIGSHIKKEFKLRLLRVSTLIATKISDRIDVFIKYIYTLFRLATIKVAYSGVTIHCIATFLEY